MIVFGTQFIPFRSSKRSACPHAQPAAVAVQATAHAAFWGFLLFAVVDTSSLAVRRIILMAGCFIGKALRTNIRLGVVLLAQIGAYLIAQCLVALAIVFQLFSAVCGVFIDVIVAALLTPRCQTVAALSVLLKLSEGLRYAAAGARLLRYTAHVKLLSQLGRAAGVSSTARHCHA